MMTGLMIYRLSHASAPITGNTEIILLCDKVMKDDIEIRFFETKNGKRIWECLADFNPLDVHKQVAICFRTPTYYLKKIENPVHVKIQLRRPSDGKCGECYPFILTPNFSDFKNRKRSRISSDGFKHLLHNPVHVSQLPIPNNTEALMNVSYNTSESIMENIETIPKTSGVFCPPLSSNAYNPLSSGFEWTPPLQSTYQLTNENSNMLCGQAEVNVQTPTAVLVYVDQQPNYPEILTTNQYDTSESKSIKKILEIGSVSNNVMQSPSNTSVYIQPSPTYSPIETQLSIENPNTMYGQADIHFQPNIDFPTYSPNTSTARPTLLSTSSKMADVLDFLTCTTENAHSTNSMEISTSELCNIDPYDLLIDDVENLSANLSASLSI